MACNSGARALLRCGTRSQIVAVGRFQIESSCSVFRPKLSEEERLEEGRSLFSNNYELKIWRFGYSTFWDAAAVLIFICLNFYNFNSQFLHLTQNKI